MEVVVVGVGGRWVDSPIANMAPAARTWTNKETARNPGRRCYVYVDQGLPIQVNLKQDLFYAL